MPDWTNRWGYRWFLSYEDGDNPPPPPRASVHARLRFPDTGGAGGSGGAGGGRRRYGDGDGVPLASAGLLQVGAGRGDRRQGGHAEVGRRHAGGQEALLPPLIDTDSASGPTTSGDPFAASDEALDSPGQLVVGTPVLGDPQMGKAAAVPDGVRDGVHALSHESAHANASVEPELQLHELVQEGAGGSEHGQDENGGARAAEAASDVHGCFHALVDTGARGTLVEGLQEWGSDAALVTTQSILDGGSSEGNLFGPHSPRDGPRDGPQPRVFGLGDVGPGGPG